MPSSQPSEDVDRSRDCRAPEEDLGVIVAVNKILQSEPGRFYAITHYEMFTSGVEISARVGIRRQGRSSTSWDEITSQVLERGYTVALEPERGPRFYAAAAASHIADRTTTSTPASTPTAPTLMDCSAQTLSDTDRVLSRLRIWASPTPIFSFDLIFDWPAANLRHLHHTFDIEEPR